MKKQMTVLLAVLLLAACTKPENGYLYEVNTQTVRPGATVKNNPKSDIEYLSVANSDLTGQALSTSDLQVMGLVYQGMGDKALIGDILLRNFLNKPGVSLPTNAQMRADVPKFIDDTYRKFFVRKPSEYEKWQLKKMIDEDPNLSPELIYYSFITSNEYRFY